MFISVGFVANCATIHVDINNSGGTEDGISWSTAYTDLQAALSISISGDIILIAEGTYKPTSGSDPSISFELINGVALFGGYQSGGTGSRNPAIYTTALSGDLGGANSFSVIFSENVGGGTLLDGLTITGGMASGECSNGAISGRQKFGGGWFNRNGSPRINNCIFVSNQSTCNGGAMYNDGGAGNSCSPIYTNCTFDGNFADLAAGAVYNNGNTGSSNSSFTNCRFIYNGTNTGITSYGAAIYNFGKNGSANATLINCLLAFNSGFAGGSVYCLGENGVANITAINCTFYENQAVQNGGAMYFNAGEVPSIGTSVGTIGNSIFWGNIGGAFGGDIFRILNGAVNIQECIVDVANCMDIAEGNVDANCIGGIQYNADPLFSNPGADDFNLSMGSMAINEGLNSMNGTSTDLDGMPRIQQTTIDLGALESPFPPLGVELSAFSANRLDQAVILDWTTLTEIHHDHFEIERSADGIYFQSIGEEEGINYSNTKTDYQFVDNSPLMGTNYYRIKSVDLSKAYRNSPVRSVVFSSSTFVIYPNPTSEYITIQSDKEINSDLAYYISNAQGQIILTDKIKARNYSLLKKITLPAHWESGLYFIHFDPSTFSTDPIKFSLQRLN